MTEDKQSVQPKLGWSQPPQECFSDVFWTSVSAWSATITFGLRMTRTSEIDTPTIRMRMSPQQAKALSILLLRAVRAYENKANITIALPDDLLNELGISQEDWKPPTK